MRRPGGTTGALLAAVGAAALWGTTGTAQALGPEDSDPVSVGALRIAVGSLVLLLLAIRGIPTGGAAPALARVPLPVMLLIGGLSVAAYQVCFFIGVARAGVAVGTVVALGVAPLATGALGLLLRERPGRRWMLATAGAVTGIVLLVAGSGGGGHIDVLGIAAALGAGIAYAGNATAARALILRGLRGVAVMASFFSLGALILLPTLFFVDLSWLATRSGLVMVLWLGLGATGLSYFLFQHALSRLTASTVATLTLAEPVTAALLGVLVLREQLSSLTAVGIVVVVLSLLVVAMRPRRRPTGARHDAVAQG